MERVPYGTHRWGAPFPWVALAVLLPVLAAALAALLFLGPLKLLSFGTIVYLLAYLILWLAGPPGMQAADAVGAELYRR